jgi:tetratricopeptide (TPR) repeat protein
LWLVLAVCLSYANVLAGDFQFDDYNVIVNEAQVLSWANWFASLGNGIRPLLKFTYTLNWTLGAGEVGFHLVNLLIHLLNSYLVYRVARLFVQQQWRSDELQLAPLFAALLFAVHPVNTEAVSYISGRSASLMTLFYLGGLLVYISGRLQQNALKVYVLTPIFFVAALCVKETAVTFPLALLTWEIFCGGRWKTSFSQMWPSWVVLCCAALLFIFSASYAAQMQRSIEFNSLQGNLGSQLAGFAYLMQQWALPLWLNIDPDLPLRSGIGEAGWSLAFCVLCVALILIFRSKRPWLSFALAWAMLHLIPLYLFLPRLDIANERQLYLAAWPLLLACAIELTLWLNRDNSLGHLSPPPFRGRAREGVEMLEFNDSTPILTFPLQGGRNWFGANELSGLKRRALLLTAATLLLLALASLTVLRNQVYASEISLWEDTAKKSPHKARVHNNLGYAYQLALRKEEARREFNIALQLDPNLYKARYNLQRLDEAP